VHLAPRPDEHVIIDASRPSFLDSSGLAVLLAAATLAHAHGAGVHLAAPQPRVIPLLEITGTWRRSETPSGAGTQRPKPRTGR
jgi:anti-anti-sigma factor